MQVFRREFAASDRVPDVRFFLFGMGLRATHFYHAGQLREAPGGRVVRRWKVREEIIAPAEYRVVLAFKATGNLHVMRDRILGLREVYDRNNGKEEEADNLGQALYLVSLVSDKSHPLVSKVLAELPRWEVTEGGRRYIKGRSDFAFHPVYQTKWLKFGLRSLGLPDPYSVQLVPDGYSALVWWDYRDAHVPGKDARDRGDYPYLGWACDHFHGEKGNPISNRDYPLTWEQRASQARYAGLDVISPVFSREKIAAPHTWHAAELFLYLWGKAMEKSK